jgi:hypothetical protein
MTILRTARGRAIPVGMEEMEVSRRVSSTLAWRGSWLRRSEMPSSGEVLGWCASTSLLGVGWAVVVLPFATAGFLGFNRNRLTGCCGLRRRLFRLGHLTGGCHFWLVRCLHDLVREGFGSGGRSGGIDNTPPSDDVGPPLTQVHLVSRGLGPLRFWGGRFACGSVPITPFRRSLCKSCLRLFPFDTTPVVCPYSCSTGAAPEGLGTHQRGENPHTRHTGVHVRSYATYGRSAGNAGIAKNPLVPRMAPQWPAAHRARWEITPWTPPVLEPQIRWNGEWGDGPCQGPDRGNWIGAAWLPGHECSGLPAPLRRRSQVSVSRNS